MYVAVARSELSANPFQIRARWRREGRKLVTALLGVLIIGEREANVPPLLDKNITYRGTMRVSQQPFRSIFVRPRNFKIIVSPCLYFTCKLIHNNICITVNRN